MVRAEQVVIPNSVKAIDLGAFNNFYYNLYTFKRRKISTYALIIDEDDLSSNF